ncbi:MAG: helix-turn-helix domain-containing protein [Bacteroidales bacterium]|jgi:transcriptional regulator with XRE-family HTH domain|nr:helix-turn-helix domain-containing protein [Bacteroidales bacterium]
MTDRIKAVQDYLGLSTAQFADKIGLNRSNLTHIYSGRNQPSLDVTKKILNTVKEINPEWLVMGNGEMFKSKVASSQYDLFSMKESVSAIEVPEQVNKISDEEIALSKMTVSENSSKRKSEPAITSPKFNIPTVKPVEDHILDSQQNKKIEKIIILYDDQTFTIHYPQ